MTTEQYMDNNRRADLDRRMDAIERGYEFLLAYAAQGAESHRGSQHNVIGFLEGMRDSLAGLGEEFAEFSRESDSERVAEYEALLESFSRDSRAAHAGVCLVLGREDISSRLVDSLNALSPLRAVLTGMFLLDSAFGISAALRAPDVR